MLKNDAFLLKRQLVLRKEEKELKISSPKIQKEQKKELRSQHALRGAKTKKRKRRGKKLKRSISQKINDIGKRMTMKRLLQLLQGWI